MDGGLANVIFVFKLIKWTLDIEAFDIIWSYIQKLSESVDFLSSQGNNKLYMTRKFNVLLMLEQVFP